MEVHFMTEGEAQEMEKKTFTWRERPEPGEVRVREPQLLQEGRRQADEDVRCKYGFDQD